MVLISGLGHRSRAWYLAKRLFLPVLCFLIRAERRATGWKVAPRFLRLSPPERGPKAAQSPSAVHPPENAASAPRSHLCLMLVTHFTSWRPHPKYTVKKPIQLNKKQVHTHLNLDWQEGDLSNYWGIAGLFYKDKTTRK